MTNAVITWFEKETGILKTDIVALEPGAIAFFKNLITGLTPIIEQAATDAVLAAVATPGTGAMKAAAALATATFDLESKGVPVVKGDLVTYIQAAYKNLPDAVQGNAAALAVEGVAINQIDAVAAEVEAPAVETAPAA